MNAKSSVIAICNQKGGVGKTVTTVSLGVNTGAGATAARYFSHTLPE